VISATFDSNIYVSALQFGGVGARLLGMARAGAIRIDTSDAILAEVIGVLRDKFGWDGYRLHFANLERRRGEYRGVQFIGAVEFLQTIKPRP